MKARPVSIVARLVVPLPENMSQTKSPGIE